MSDKPLIERLRGPISRPTVPMDLGNGQTIQVRGLLHGYEDDQLHAEAARIIEAQAAEIDLLKRALQLEKEQRAFIQSQYDKLNEFQTRHATECATAKV